MVSTMPVPQVAPTLSPLTLVAPGWASAGLAGVARRRLPVPVPRRLVTTFCKVHWQLVHVALSSPGSSMGSRAPPATQTMEPWGMAVTGARAGAGERVRVRAKARRGNCQCRHQLHHRV